MRATPHRRACFRAIGWAEGTIGVLDSNGATFALEGQFGKRFSVGSNLAYNPFLRFVLARQSFFQIGLVSFSIFF